MRLRWRRILNLDEVQRPGDYELETVVAIREHIPELAHLSVDKLCKLWSEYSDSKCAQWLCHSKSELKEFWEWCCTETYDEGDY